MSFFEDIATALDNVGIESRVNSDVLFVPITSELEIQFREIDPFLPAANVYIAAATGNNSGFEPALVSVVFSVEDAVQAVNEHVATDQVVTVLRDLLQGTDERIADLEFYQDPVLANEVYAEVTDSTGLVVTVEAIDGVPTAHVQFIAYADVDENVVDEAIDEFLESEENFELDPLERERLFAEVMADLCDTRDEVLDLGSFTDFDKLFDVLSLASEQAENWEVQLVPVEDDEVEVYDLFGADHGDFDDDLDDDDLEDDDLEDEDFDDDLEDEDFDDDLEDEDFDDDLEDEELGDEEDEEHDDED